ncbi:MAG: hypothetical protein SGI88_17715 [Candidatus Hydrogenedentes bacterium]|nr:hypothetical protein [Candidatus Hydrogenedentota bacterium]
MKWLTQKNWVMWAMVVIVAITLFGPSAVAYAATPAAPSAAFRELLQSVYVNCASQMHQF